MENTVDFVHLHLHTDYSLLDGACPIHVKEEGRPDIVKLAKKYHMKAVAMTDHGFMGGAIDFYQSLSQKGLKPIIGCEMYVSPVDIFDVEKARDSNIPNIKGFHLVLLAQDYEGYQNLCRLNSIAHLQGSYYKPRVDKNLLRKHSKGLIALSACIQGEPQVAIKNGDHKRARKAMEEYLDIFGRENYYVELMDHGMEEQKLVNKEMVKLSHEFNLPLVATNDCHYLLKEHAAAHDTLLCIQTGSQLSEEKRYKFSSDQFYFKTGQEMLELFKELPQSVSNTVAVAERCNLRIPTVDDGKANHYPVYRLSDESDAAEDMHCPKRRACLREICTGNLTRRYKFNEAEASDDFQKSVLARMDFELGVIDRMGFVSYFLVVWDFVNAAKRMGVPVGPGRGSGAGSIIAYLTGITDIDPIRYNLLFERFLNPERVSPPDFDIDFCERRRGEVIQYVRERYGLDKVAQIATYGTLKPKAVVKDVGRALGMDFDKMNRITKLISIDPKITLAKAVEDSPELKQMIDDDADVRRIFELARPLEGLNRHAGIHASAVVIGDQELCNLAPLSHGAGQEVKTQYPGPQCEQIGLLKMDFLGLKTLTIINDAAGLIRKNHGVEIDFSTIELDDKATFRLINRGDTVSVFQLESKGMQNLCSRFGVDRIEDVIALIALYRPGPMEFIDDFIAGKTGRIQLEYEHPKMEAILKETQGIMLYQEQIMQVVQELGGFSLGGADILRRAIGKKKQDVLEAQQEKFVKGCEKHIGMAKESAESVWEKIMKFANYGFNKSHSAAYAFLSYRTAYLKANYPVEFMTAVLTSELGNSEKLAFLIAEIREMGVKVLPPDVNTSEMAFSAGKDKCIRFGLGAVKGVGESAAAAIIKARTEGGLFENLMDFAVRIALNVNARALEALVRVGALDAYGLRRSQLIEIMPALIQRAKTKAKEGDMAQADLFGMFAPPAAKSKSGLDFQPPDIPEFAQRQILADEKTLLGFYVSGHPLGEHVQEIKRYSTTTISEMATLPADPTPVRIGALVTSVEIKKSKKTDKSFAIVTLEDTGGDVECAVFSEVYDRVKDKLKENNVLIVTGFAYAEADDENGADDAADEGAERRQGTAKVKFNAEEILLVDEAAPILSAEVHVHIFEASTKREDVQRLQTLCSENPGDARLVLCAVCEGGETAFVETSRAFSIRMTTELEGKLKAIFGEDGVKIIAKTELPQPRPRFGRPNNRAGHAQRGDRQTNK